MAEHVRRLTRYNPHDSRILKRVDVPVREAMLELCEVARVGIEAKKARSNEESSNKSDGTALSEPREQIDELDESMFQVDRFGIPVYFSQEPPECGMLADIEVEVLSSQEAVPATVKEDGVFWRSVRSVIQWKIIHLSTEALDRLMLADSAKRNSI